MALAAIVCLYNLPQLLSGSVQYDGLEVHYAAQRYLSEELHAGRIPFWTPFIFSGFPFLADLQVAAWYPLNWPFFLVGVTPRAIDAELLLHDLIACAGAYLLGLRLIGRPPAAMVVAICYGLSGWFSTHSQHVGMFDTAAWLPWLLLVLLHLAEGLSHEGLARAGLLGAAIALPGHFQLALYTFSFVGVWAAVEACATRSRTMARRFAIGLAASGVFGGCLAGVMILPALELVSHSERAKLNALALPDIGYFHLPSLLTLVYPDYYGLLTGHYVGPGDSTQHYFYAGIALVPLALLGLRNRRVARAALALGVPFVWYAAGPSAGLYRLVARLPGFASLELPMHGWFLAALGLALLAGAGLATLERRIGQRWCLVLIGLTAVDVLVFNQLLNPLAFARTSVEQTPLEALARSVATAQPPVQRVYGPPLAQVGYRNHALQSRVQTTYGYNPLELSAYADYADAAEANPRLISGMAPSHELTQDGALQPTTGALPLASFAVRTVLGDNLAEADPAGATLVAGPLAVQADPAARAMVQAQGMDWLEAHYATRTQNLLRVAIPAYPGWEATLNGTPLTLTTVDHAFIGVLVPPGEGDVRLAYRPRMFWTGLSVTGVAGLVTLAMLWRRPRGAAASRSRRAPEA